MLHKMVEKEYEFFTGSSDSQCFGFNPEPEKVFPVVEREHKRRSSSTAPSNKTKESLEVVVKRVNEVLDRKDEALNKIFIDGLTKLKIGNCSDLNKSLSVLRKDPYVAKLFINKFKEETNGYVLSTREMEYLRVCSMHMCNRWEYDHEYFQRMIDRTNRLRTSETVGAIIVNMDQLNYDSESEGESMPGLQ